MRSEIDVVRSRLSCMGLGQLAVYCEDVLGMAIDSSDSTDTLREAILDSYRAGDVSPESLPETLQERRAS